MSIKSLKNQSYTNKSYFNSANLTGGGTAAPVITSIIICDSSYNNLDDTALAPGGSYVKLIGTGFKTGCTVYFNNATVTATFVSSTEVRIQTPSTSVGSYNIMLFNPGTDGGAIYLNLSVSNAPTWTTNAGSLGTQYETTAVNTSVSATGDTPITYSLFSGSLPAGTTLSSDGTLSGTAPAEASSTTYSFTLNAKDAQNQDTTRSFSLTINVDVVSWTTPTSNQVISSYEYSPISNVTLLASSAAGYSANNYSANALPTGITLAGNTISGTANTTGNTYTRLTATANTTGRTATRDIVFNVNQDVVTWSSPADATQYTLSGGTAMANVTLSAASAAGRTITYTANALPSGLSLSGSTISGTPDTAQTVYTLLTATAATTNRSATRTISWSISLGDAYWKYTTLALNGTTTVTPFITDSSNNNAQLIVGDSRVSNYNPYQQGYYSLFNDGTGSNATVGSGSTAFNLTGDFTIEAWVYPTSFAGDNWGIIDARTSGASPTNWVFALEDQGTETYKILFYSGGYNRSTGQIISANKWTHVVVVRNGSALRFFVNGVLDYYNGSFGTGELSPGSTTPVIGSKDSGISTYKTAGYISNLRLVNGTAVYTTSATTIGTSVFTPSTTPLTAVANTTLLTCQDNRYIDDSPNNFTITPGSASAIRISSGNPFGTPYQANTQYYSTYFDGTGDYLTSNATTALGSADFTIEFFVYPTRLSGTQGILSKRASAVFSPFLIQFSSTNLAAFFSTSGSNWEASINPPSSSPALNTWSHVAFVRSGGTITCYLNGTSVGTTSISGSLYSNASGISIGASTTAGDEVFQGHISNLRIVAGTAIVPAAGGPTSKLTAVTNTSLLTCQDSTLIDNSTNAFTITRNGDTKPLAVSPFTPLGYTSTPITTYGSSYHLNATRDASQIYTPTSAVYNVGSSDFTLEFWVNFNDTTTQQQEIFRFDGASTYNPYLMLWSTNAFYFRTTETTGDIVTAFASGITAGQWVHLCVTRSGNNYTIYRNGISVATGTSTGVANENKKLILGSGNFKGYLSDVRFTKGSVLYTSNFVPEFTRPSTVSANTQLLTLQTNGAHNNSTFKDESSFTNVINRVGNATNGTFSPYGDNWSCYFDGSGDYLTTSSFSLTLATWTMEMWINTTSTTQYQTFVHRGNGASWSVTSIFDLYQTGTTNSSLTFLNGTGGVSMSGTSVINDGKWHHVALTYDGTNYRMFIDGKLEAYQAGSAMSTASYLFYIGYDPRNARYTTGNISNFRFVDGTVVYPTSSTTTGTTVFTPSTTPLTAVANTALLVCNTNRFIDFSAKNSTITKSGDISIQKFSPFNLTTTPKYHSTYFNGTDYLQTPASSATSIIGGTGAITTTSTFTIECWIYQTTRQSYDSGCMIGDMGTNGSIYWGFGPNATGKLAFNWYDGASKSAVGNTTIPLNTWTHIALSISSGSIKLFVDGTLQTITGTSSTTNQSGGFGYLLVGGFYTFGTTYGYYGHISNLRIVKSALYSTTFTPSTSPLTAVANTGLLICQDNTIKDNSTNNLLITSGTTTVKPLPVSPFTPTANTGLSYSPSTFGASVYLDGTGDYLTVPHHPSQWLASNDFTIEFWLYTLRTGSEQTIIGKQWQGSQAAYGSFVIYIETGNTVRVLGSTNGGSWDLDMGASSYVVKTNEWTHFALTRSGSTFRLFLNGVLDRTATLAGILNRTTDLLTIGAAGPQTGYNAQVYGWLSDIRMIVGKALYTSNFYPGLTPLTNIAYSNNSTDVANTSYATFFLNGTSGGIIDQSRTVDLETVGDVKLAQESPFEGSYYSNYFDGTGDYLQVPANAALALTGDFTVEAWVYPTVINTFNMILGSDNGSSSDYLGIKSTSLEMAINTGLTYPSWSYSFTAGRWYHICVTRSGSTLTAYVNGTSLGGLSYAQQFLVSGVGVQVGRYGYASSPYYFTGNISNVRIIKGTAIAPPAGGPTSPVAAVSGTSLLTCQSNKFVDNSSNAFTITRNGDTKVQTFNPFKRNTGQSYYFDGTGDYLDIPSSPNFSQTGAWTVEMWIYPTVSNNCYLYSQVTSNFLQINLTGSMTINIDRSGVGNIITSSHTAPIGAWTHIALVSDGTNMKLFMNGLQSGATAAVGTQVASATSTRIGAYQNSGSAGTLLYYGYIKDLRITKGVARYTSNNQVNLTSTFEVK
jgi:hypothetical protein